MRGLFSLWGFCPKGDLGRFWLFFGFFLDPIWTHYANPCNGSSVARLNEADVERMRREAERTGRKVSRSDSEVQGLRVRVTPRGQRSYQFRWMRAGEAGAMALQTTGSLSKARAEAFEMRAIVERGRDPRDEASYQQAAGVTFGELWDAYQARHLPTLSPSSQRNARSLWGLGLSVYARRQVARVRPLEFAALRDQIGEVRGRYAANRTLALASSLVGWASNPEVGLYEGRNPASRVSRLEEFEREVVLSLRQRAQFVAAVDREGGVLPDLIWRGYIHLLLETGQRKCALLAARWDWIEADADGFPVLVVPAAHLKQKSEHVLPLSTRALAVLDDLPRTSAWIFPRRDGNRPRHKTVLHRIWRRLVADAGLEDLGNDSGGRPLGRLRIHDLRHALGQSLGEANVGLATISAILGHAKTQTSERYVRPSAGAGRAALDSASERLGRQYL